MITYVRYKDEEKKKEFIDKKVKEAMNKRKPYKVVDLNTMMSAFTGLKAAKEELDVICDIEKISEPVQNFVQRALEQHNDMHEIYVMEPVDRKDTKSKVFSVSTNIMNI
jgi:hypothetical protein